MPGPASRNLKQDLTYWGIESRNEYQEIVWADPILVKGFWTFESRLVRNSTGDEVNTQAVIHVSQDVFENEYLALGDHTEDSDPHNLTDGESYEVKAFLSSPDLRFLEQARVAFV